MTKRLVELPVTAWAEKHSTHSVLAAYTNVTYIEQIAWVRRALDRVRRRSTPRASGRQRAPGDALGAEMAAAAAALHAHVAERLAGSVTARLEQARPTLHHRGGCHCGSMVLLRGWRHRN